MNCVPNPTGPVPTLTLLPAAQALPFHVSGVTLLLPEFATRACSPSGEMATPTGFVPTLTLLPAAQALPFHVSGVTLLLPKFATRAINDRGGGDINKITAPPIPRIH
jgi:hypothetical protein